MYLNTFHLIFFVSTLAAALPFEALNLHNFVARSRTYAIVNVDGGSTSAPPPSKTTVVENTTKTVQVTDTPATVTDEVTATPSSSKSSSSSTPTPTTTPTPSVVTVIVTESAAPTEYYDDGLWKTSYPVKTFATATTAAAAY